MQCSAINTLICAFAPATFLYAIRLLHSKDPQPEPTVCPASAMELSAVLQYLVRKCRNTESEKAASFSALKQAVGFQANAVL